MSEATDEPGGEDDRLLQEELTSLEDLAVEPPPAILAAGLADELLVDQTKLDNVVPTELPPVIKTLEEQAMDAAKAAKPSEEWSYWARRSCNSCHGRGIEGKITITFKGNNKVTEDAVCNCAVRRVQRWTRSYIKEWLQFKANQAAQPTI